MTLTARHEFPPRGRIPARRAPRADDDRVALLEPREQFVELGDRRGLIHVAEQDNLTLRGEQAGGHRVRLAAVRTADQKKVGMRAGKGLHQRGCLVFAAVIHHQHFTGVVLSRKIVGDFIQFPRAEIDRLVVGWDDDGQKGFHLTSQTGSSLEIVVERDRHVRVIRPGFDLKRACRVCTHIGCFLEE